MLCQFVFFYSPLELEKNSPRIINYNFGIANKCPNYNIKVVINIAYYNMGIANKYAKL
jgi:hypothetical protein